jgi:nitrous oxidase accessory protein NosD
LIEAGLIFSTEKVFEREGFDSAESLYQSDGVREARSNACNFGRKAQQEMRNSMAKTKIATILVGLAVVGTGSAAKAQIVVGQCMGTSPYNTIQSAVNAAPSGSTIKVCPTGYTEQVVIQKPLTLQGITAQNLEGALVIPPSGGLVATDPGMSNYGPQILVLNTTGVTISGLIVDAVGNHSACSDPYVTGILFHNASGTVRKTAVRNQIAGNSNGNLCEADGLYAVNDSAQQPNTVTVQNSDFRNQSATGIFAYGPGLTMHALNNFVSGPDNWAGSSIGILYWNGPTGTIQGNTVVNEVNTLLTTVLPTSGAIGIVMACGTASVTGNMVSDTQEGLYLGCPNQNGFPTNATVSQNKIFETKLGNGIYVNGTGNSITNNMIIGSSSAGILLDSKLGANGNTVSGNTITEACIGIDTTAAMGTNKLANNTFNAVYVPTQKNAPACGPTRRLLRTRSSIPRSGTAFTSIPMETRSRTM